ncbi:hypothetical protein PENSPDRAFT_682217 [Peniophora sp. CONT]|nr:hypothetical protein PENSPDRAFT_682217 [Peniophora sp. CONT]
MPVKKRPHIVYSDKEEESTDNILALLYAMRTPKASPVKPATKDKGKAPAHLGASRASSASTSGYSNVTTPSISDNDVKPRFKTPIKKCPRVVYDSEDDEDDSGQNGSTQSVLAPLHGLLSPKASSVKLSAMDKGKGKAPAPASTWTPFPLKTSPSTPRLSAAPLKLSQENNVPLISAISIPTPAPSPTKLSRAMIRALVAPERSLDYMDVDAPITNAPSLGPTAAERSVPFLTSSTAVSQDPIPVVRSGVRHSEPPLYDLTTEDSCVVLAQPPIDMLQDVRKLVWATQWELSRLVTEGKHEWNSPTLRKKLAAGELNGGAVDVARSVAEIVLGSAVRAPASAKEYEARAPWAELDREASALDVAVYGCMGTLNDAINNIPEGWYGGNIHHSAKLVSGADENAEPTITLLRPEHHSSSLFARRFESDSYLRLRIAPELLGDADNFERIARGFLLRPFVICGRTYEVRYSNRDDLPGCKGRRFMSFHKFFQWCKTLEPNSEQSMAKAKYCARIALGFSNSVPGGMLILGSKGIVHLHPDAEARRSKLRPLQIELERARIHPQS